jgi:predicted amidophosphoribosyltransferase
LTRLVSRPATVYHQRRFTPSIHPVPANPMLVELARGLRHLVYPGVCARCDALISDADADFCPACAQALTDDPHFTCPRCTSAVGEHSDVSDGCPSCRGERFAYASVFRLGGYDGALRSVVLAMKHRAGERLAESVGRLWAVHHAARFRALGVDVVIPVPLHWWRRLRRGYNQSEALSAAVARMLGVDHRPG